MIGPKAFARIADPRRRIRAWPLSTRVMGALALALLPLGMLALAAAFANYRTVTQGQDRLARARLEALREAATPELANALSTMRASALLGDKPGCRVGLQGLARNTGLLSEIILLDREFALLCTDVPRAGVAGMTAAAREAVARGQTALIDPERGDLLLVLRQPTGDAGTTTVVARATAAIAGQRLVAPQLRGSGDSVRLFVGDRPLIQVGQPVQAQNWSRVSTPLDAGVRIELAIPRAPITLAQALGVALPALMWLTAVLICWVALGIIVVQPLKRMQGAVERYAAGNRAVRATPAAGSGQEMLEFAHAFDAMADQADGHEAEMQAALARQMALTREVHHRVKNNLQIVSSLLSLQARGVANPEVAAAYALIRQRVTALSLVHRWIYADGADEGVDLRGLLADLCANLAHGFDREGGGRMPVHCVSAPLLVHQDTALPLAFLISEMAGGAVVRGVEEFWIRAEAVEGGGLLTLSSEAFAGEGGARMLDPASQRIVDGLVRQLRSRLIHELEGRFSIRFPVQGARAG